MENDERKQTPRRVPFTQLGQEDSDFAMAMALQQQESAFSMLARDESESSDEEESDFGSSNNNNDYENFERYEFEAELELLEGQEINSEEDMDEEDDIDPDELSYEELIALGEIIGEEKRGLSLSEIPKCLIELKTQNGIDRCVICQVEYEEGESLVGLCCEHPYHAECISKWLQVKKICPICGVEVSPPKIDKIFN